MVCNSCGTENRAGRRFCMHCGQELAKACPRCAATNEPDASFCGECGSPLTQSSSREQDPTPPRVRTDASTLSERRLVSVLFVDLVGFTALSADRDPEETRELLSRYFDLARDVVARHGGTIEKFIGDAVMAVWGAPTAREDDAERAVRAALELVGSVHRLGPAVAARAGVLTGEAAVTVGATNEGMVAGDLVNTASRLQSAASAGEVLVGEATQRAAGRAIVFEPAGAQTLKGKASPVPSWRALRVVAERGGRRRSEVIEPPFVGREDELRLLKDLFHATSREKRTRLVSVTGQAGIGKSRLAWEFLKYIDGLLEDIWWHEGRCPPYGDGVTFWALGEMIRRRAGLLETDDAATTRERIAATVAEHVPDERERRWIERALLALLGLEPPPTGGPEELFAAWRTFFERIAATGVCVLVFEDLQWADLGLLDFIDHLVDWSRGVGIYVVTLARPELLERRPEWGRGKRSFVAITLEPMDAAVMRHLLEGLVPALPEGAVQAIVDRAGGVPLYVVETVRMLVEQGRLVPDGTTYRPAGDLGSIAVPETLHALVESRLDALEAADRSILQDAAVLGQTFTIDGLVAVTGMSVAELELRLRGLIRRELITVNPDPSSPERGRYVFVQALVREVAYGMLARRDRKARHLAVARWLESTRDEELASALAAHYLAAHRNAPEGPEADALAVQARLTLRAAAARAAALGSQQQALTFLEQALEITPEPAEQADLLELAGEAASLATRHEAAEAHFRRAIELRRTLGDRSAIARVTRGLGWSLINAFRNGSAVAELEPAAREFADLAADPGFIALESELARALFLDGNQARAIEISDRVLAAAERQDLLAIVTDALITRGSALSVGGRTYEGIGAIRAGIELADEAGLRETALRGRVNLGGMLEASDPRSMFAASRAALDEAIRLGDRSIASVALQNAASAALEIGEWDWVLQASEAALDGEVGDLDRAMAEVCIMTLGAFRGEDVAAEARRLEEAIQPTELRAEALFIRWAAAFGAGRMAEAYDAAVAHATAHPEEASLLYVDAAFAALWDRDLERTMAALRAIDATFVHGRFISLARATIRAGIAALEGRGGEALVGFRQSLAEWRALDVPWRVALSAILMATVLDPSEPDVRSAVEEARQILRSLGAQPFLEHLNAVASSAPAHDSVARHVPGRVPLQAGS